MARRERKTRTDNGDGAVVDRQVHPPGADLSLDLEAQQVVATAFAAQLRIRAKGAEPQREASFLSRSAGAQPHRLRSAFHGEVEIAHRSLGETPGAASQLRAEAQRGFGEGPFFRIRSSHGEIL